jgi:hypothetical protein
VPVNPDSSDLQELLEVYLKKLKVPNEYADKLRNGLQDSLTSKDVQFKNVLKDVTTEMGKDKRKEVRDKIYELEDIEPLFAPHTFWETQPVP